MVMGSRSGCDWPVENGTSGHQLVKSGSSSDGQLASVSDVGRRLLGPTRSAGPPRQAQGVAQPVSVGD